MSFLMTPDDLRTVEAALGVFAVQLRKSGSPQEHVKHVQKLQQRYQCEREVAEERFACGSG